jgi:hypothetical protein
MRRSANSNPAAVDNKMLRGAHAAVVRCKKQGHGADVFRHHRTLQALALANTLGHIGVDAGAQLALGHYPTRHQGIDPDAIAAVLEQARASDRPTMIDFKTTIGFGAPTKAGTNKVHGSPLGADEIDGRGGDPMSFRVLDPGRDHGALPAGYGDLG